MVTEAHKVITILATLYSWKVPGDLLLVPVFVIEAHGVIPPHVNKVCSTAQGLLELLTEHGISRGTMIYFLAQVYFMDSSWIF